MKNPSSKSAHLPHHINQNLHNAPFLYLRKGNDATSSSIPCIGDALRMSVICPTKKLLTYSPILSSSFSRSPTPLPPSPAVPPLCRSPATPPPPLSSAAVDCHLHSHAPPPLSLLPLPSDLLSFTRNPTPASVVCRCRRAAPSQEPKNIAVKKSAPSMALRATLWKYVEGTCRNWKPWTAWERGLSLEREASLDEVKEPPTWEYVKGTCQKWKPREE
ncbi:hypothetical protein ACS0TY_019527 [Phlomoides rotata]